MVAAGFREVPSFNPYWDTQGRTFEDHDGYRVVLQHEHWSTSGDHSGFSSRNASSRPIAESHCAETSAR
jgi:hypothetical protein